MDTSKIREAFLNAPAKVEDIEIPDWLTPFLDPGTELAIKDIPSDTLGLLQKQAQKDQNEVGMTASVICHCLINKATGETIFQPADRDALAALGATKLSTIGLQVGKFFGLLSGDAVAEAKKN